MIGKKSMNERFNDTKANLIAYWARFRKGEIVTLVTIDEIALHEVAC